MPSKIRPRRQEGDAHPEFHAVTKKRLSHLARFSETYGKFRYCSCMRWRLASTDFKRSTTEIRVAALNERICNGIPVGVLAYLGGEPVGWCSVAPRETCEALERYKKLERIDEAKVWSVVCFFVDSRARRRGLTLGLLKAAVEYAHSEGAAIVEGCPVDPGELYGYMGSPSTFRRAGFREVTPSGRERRIFRHIVRSGKPPLKPTVAHATNDAAVEGLGRPRLD